MRGVAWLALLALVSGCGSAPGHAPVSDRTPAVKKVAASKPGAKAQESDWRPATHSVQKGDTLYALALEYGFDYKELAEWNNISAPYVIRVGQQLRLTPSQSDGVVVSPLKPVSPVPEAVVAVDSRTQPTSGLIKTQPKAGKIPYSAKAEIAPVAVATKPEAPLPKVAPAPEEKAKVPDVKLPPPASEEKKPAMGDDELEWAWPTKGKVITGFNESANLKGMDISGKAGQAVFASAPGKVVYSGSGLRGYGKLVIIKHNKTYLSAYAHNSQLLVKEGQNVQKGQRIAEMGDSDSDQVKLHFEIRRLGKPVDPLRHLPDSNG